MAREDTKSAHYQEYIENLLKLLYVLEDSFELYRFLGVYFSASDDMDDSVALILTTNLDMAAFSGQIKLLKQMKYLITSQRSLKVAAMASPYG